MFFSTYVLTKKGPLAKVWLAAHWDKKLTKNEVRVIDLKDTVLQIVKPAVPIALRTSGELMLGVVRIYVLKVKHVQKDATDATTTLLRGAQKHQTNLPGAKAGPHKPVDMAGAVTHLDVVVNRAGLEALCEADFSSIADIMLPGGDQTVKKPAAADGNWFLSEGGSQLELMQGQTQEDILQQKKDLANFEKLLQQQRAGTDSKSKSTTGSSVEATRGAAPAGTDLLGDLNINLEDELNLGNLAAPEAAGLPMTDVFEGAPIEELPVPTPGAEAEAIKKRLKVLNILDTKDTTISDAQREKNKVNRQDTLCLERRHGAVDEDDATARAILKDADRAVMGHAPLGRLPASCGLNAVFERAMKETVDKAIEAEEAARGTGRKTSGRDSLKLGGVEADKDAAALMAQDAPIDIFEDYQAQQLPSPDEGRTSRGKRNRDGDAEKAPQFSASALHTLGDLQGMLKGKTESCTFSTLNKNKKKQDAARTFVDVLVLASHGRVSVDQRTAHGEIVLHKTDKLNEAVIAN